MGKLSDGLKSAYTNAFGSLRRRGTWGLVTVTTVVAVALFSGVGVTMAATGVFSNTSSTPPPASPAPSATPSPTQTPVGTGASDPSAVAIEDEASQSIAPGIKRSNLPMGFSVTQNSVGVVLTFRGTCVDPAGDFRIVYNDGEKQSGGANACVVGQETWRVVTYPWDEYIRNAYCAPPVGSKSAIRAEMFGGFSEWAPFPAAYRSCPSAQVPEPPASSSPEPTVESTPEPTVESTPEPTVESTPAG
jgi:hypothetical protein